jgi:hypothetical protein
LSSPQEISLESPYIFELSYDTAYNQLVNSTLVYLGIQL